MQTLRCAVVLAVLAMLADCPTAFADIAADRAGVLETHRKIIVLLAGEDAPDARGEGTPSRVGRMLFHAGRDHAERLVDALAAEAARWNGAGPEPVEVAQLLRYLESDPDLRDADKLAFQDVLVDLRAALGALPQTAQTTALAERIAARQLELAEIERRYSLELGEIRARLGMRGPDPRRESWDEYLASLRSRYRREEIVAPYARELAAELDARGPAARPRPALPDPNEINGTRLPPKTLVLTFDDGPHGRHTDRILAILRQFEAPAIFFHVGRNLGAVNPDGKAVLGRNADVARRVIGAGHAVANHSYSHPHLPSIAEDKVTKEIDDTQALLHEVASADAPLFRAPYGARNSQLLAELGVRRLKSIMWNIDSRDWADPVPASIAQRVVDGVVREGRGIVLFHDIHERTVAALPLVLEALTREGYRFAGWDGKTFVVKDSGERSGGARAVGAQPDPGPLYRESFAVVIGINEYRSWPRLKHAVADAGAIKDLLIRKYRFKPANVFTLVDGEATRERILSLLGEKLADPKLVHREDRVLVFFAGHGATRKLASGRELGYIIPVDANTRTVASQAISMTHLQDIVDAVPAKHMLFVMDSCYSGLALTRGTAGPAAGFLREMGRRTARQMLTAGGADQEVADGGPGGHSIFTWTLLQALEGKADANGDGVITATELASHIGPVVASLSRQTPAFGNMPGSGGGEFVFELAPETEFLSAQSQQLDDEAVRLNAEIERLRVAIAAKEERNRVLRQQLAAASAAARGEAGGAPGAGNVAEDSPLRLNDLGTALYKERRYEEALARFAEAVRRDPTFALAANNLGFTYYKLARYPESIEWFERTIAIDPRRAVAYLNLGDAYLKVGRMQDARRAFERYVELAPGGRATAYVEDRLKSIDR